MKDFSEPQELIPFQVNDDVFQAAAMLPSDAAFRFQAMLVEAGDDTMAQQKVWRTFFETVLLEGRDRFLERLDSVREPIGYKKQFEIFDWLMETYGMRPTRSSDASSGGSDDPAPGTNSTDDSPSKALTLVGSPSTDSSTLPTS